ncbi:neuraminidase [Influenza A virus]|uniref:Neuraminidase n=1 Tax=Influenza A virus TaxID=11320 RepID=A0A2S1JLP6_9INFA|nr:neuraminidase [Influenza A virus]
MIPNQRITAIGSVSLIIAIICLLMQIAILTTTMTLHFGQTECSNPLNNQVMPCEPIIIERNTMHLNSTTIEREICPKVAEYKNWSKPQCQITGFAPFSKDNSIRLSASGDIWVTREPYVSCSLDKCYQFALGQGTTLKNKHSNGTTHDRTPHRTLLMSELGVPFHLGTKQVCIAWSSLSCYDGKAWLHICVTGDDKNATASIIYEGMLVDSIGSWSKNILRTQESECVCINGIYAVVMTDGSASGKADTRVLFIREGKIMNISPLSGLALYVNDRSCPPLLPEIVCVCTNDWTGSSPPIIYICMADYFIQSIYVCSGLVAHPQRNDDPSTTTACTHPTNEGRLPGVGGWFFNDGNDVWMGRTIMVGSRASKHIFTAMVGRTLAHSHSQISKPFLIDTNDWAGHSFFFSVAGKECIGGCFYVELKGEKPNEHRVGRTSTSFFAFCAPSRTYGARSWPDRTTISFLPI